MSDLVTVTVGHRLGKAEAARRLKLGFAQAKNQFGPTISIEQGAWEGDRLHFRMRAVGQYCVGTIDVLEEELRVEVSLPWLLAKAANRLIPALRTGALLLLANK